MVTAEGGDLDNLAPHAYMDYLEAATNDTRAAEYAFDLFRFGVGGDIKILWVIAEQQVAYTATN